MTLNDDTASLISELEYLIGSECYNPKSYDGWNDVEGCDFRYPVYINTSDSDNSEKKNWGRAMANKPEYIRSMKYKFGANHLFIGRGLINVLRFLENRYGLDFAELESNYDGDDD